jgi:hypothetical protein
VGLWHSSCNFSAEILQSQIIPLSFGIIADEERPLIVATHRDGRQWSL